MVRPVHGLVSSYNCSFYCLNPDLYYRDCDIVMLGMEHGKVCVSTWCGAEVGGDVTCWSHHISYS